MSKVNYMLREIHDISYELSNQSVVYPGDPPYRSAVFACIDDKGFAMSEVAMNTHMGTHWDPPIHIIKGAASIDQIPLDRFIGPARIVEIDPETDCIEPKHLKQLRLKKGSCLLFKTKNSRLLKEPAFRNDYTYISPEAAEYLSKTGIKVIGLDYFTIEGLQYPEFPAHRTLLERGVLILEAIDLSNIEPGDYNLIALPLKIKDGDGSPTRAVLVR